MAKASDVVAPYFVSQGDSSVQFKRLVRIDDGVWIDPLHIVCIEPFSIGTQGFVRISMDNGDSFTVCPHECELNKPDPQVAEDLVSRIHDQMRASSS